MKAGMGIVLIMILKIMMFLMKKMVMMMMTTIGIVSSIGFFPAEDYGALTSGEPDRHT